MKQYVHLYTMNFAVTTPHSMASKEEIVNAIVARLNAIHDGDDEEEIPGLELNSTTLQEYDDGVCAMRAMVELRNLASPKGSC